MSSRWKIVLSIFGIAACVAAATVTVAAIEISRHARDWVRAELQQQYKSDVELGNFGISVYPHIQASGEDLVLHFESRRDLPSLITVKRFTVRGSFLELLRNPRRVRFVHLEGLQINIPPREERQGGGGANLQNVGRKVRSAYFDEIVSENAVLRISTTKPAKKPLEFDIANLDMHSTSSDGEFAFRATLRNPTPPGEILSNGTFGPWNADNPRGTPVSGGYTFENADLGVFRGIAGILSSKGTYKGVLEKIETDGTTSTPDFRVTRAGHSMDLSTTFHAVVDGTNGNTYLQPVIAHFLNSELRAQGSVAGLMDKKGKAITLDVNTDHARIEDLLQLAIKESPTMTGPIRLNTKFVLYPGKEPIPDRLNLDGSFAIDSAHFTSKTVQQKFDNLSERSRGKPKETKKPQDAVGSDDVASDMKGGFRLQNGILTFLGLQFQVPGTNVRVNGTYALDDEKLNLHGTLAMQAKLSQTTTGFKSLLLKVVDPFFSKKGEGTVLPFKVTGSLHHPEYGLDFHRRTVAQNR